MEYYLEKSETVLQELKSSAQGLSAEEAAARLQRQGKNKLAEEEKRSVFRKFLDSITDPMILMLLGAALVQVIVRSWNPRALSPWAHFQTFSSFWRSSSSMRS